MTILTDKHSDYSAIDSLGIQNLYRIETIDISTIRLLNVEEDPAPQSVVTASAKSFSIWTEPVVQLTFNFEQLSFLQMPALVWFEPLTVLRLSSQAERLLLEQGKQTLNDLKPFISSSSFIKGIGQGHFDEIRQKLYQYTQLALSKPPHLINWLSLVKIVTHPLNSLQLAVLLEHFELAEEWEFSPLEKLEMRRLSPGQKQQIIQQSQEIITHSNANALFSSVWETISKILIFPWIEWREKIFAPIELNERYQRVSLQPALTEKMLLFFKILFPQIFCFWMSLEQDLFTINKKTQQDYLTIIALAKKYFCRSTPAYEFKELVYLIYCEGALKWEEKTFSFIEKVLTYSSLFQFFQHPTRQIMIRLQTFL